MKKSRGQRPKITWSDLQKEYIITYHARERFLTRFLEGKKYGFLIEHGKKSSEPRVISLVYNLCQDMKKMRDTLEEQILARLEKSKETRAYLNDSVFLAALYDKYGIQRYTFMVDDDICFVIVPHRDSGQKTVVTCLYAKHSRHRSKKKYTKKEEESIF
jgi:hypothetical protein